MAYTEDDYQALLGGLNTPRPGTYTPAADARARAQANTMPGHPSQFARPELDFFTLAATNISYNALQAMKLQAMQKAALKDKYGLTGRAKQVAEDLSAPISQGLISPGTGQKIPDLLTGDERTYFESGGEEGSYADALGLPDQQVARPVYGALAPPSESTASRLSWLSENSPAAVKALAANGFRPEDVATFHNVFVAQAAVKRATQLMEAQEIPAAAQIIAALPLQQRIIAAAFLDDAYEAASAEAASAQAQADQDARQASMTPQFDPVSGQLSTPTVGADGGVVGSFSRNTTVEQVNALGMLLETTLWGVENATHVGRMILLGTDSLTPGGASRQDLLTEAGGQMYTDEGKSFGERIGAAWNATSDGFISQAVYNEAVTRFGKRDTDIMLKFYRAQQEQDPEAISEFYASIDNDPAATALITSAMRGENIGGDQNSGAELFATIAAGDQGNFGNLLAGNVFGMDPDAAAFRITRDSANVGSWFVYDPLTYLFGAGKALRGVKYGLDAAVRLGNGSYTRGVAAMLRADKLGGPVISRIPGLNRNGVRMAHDDFGRSVEALVAAEGRSLADAAAAEKTIRKRFIKNDNAMFTWEDVKLAKKHGLYSAEDWARYYDEIADAEDLLRGKPFAVTAPPVDPTKSGLDFVRQFGPEGQVRARQAVIKDATNRAQENLKRTTSRLDGQKVRRQLYVPHATIARQVVAARFAEATVGSGDTKSYQRAMAKLERVMGPEWAALAPDEQMAALTNAISTDADIARALGSELSGFKTVDGVMQRSVIGRRVDKVFGRNDATKRVGAALGLYKRVKDGGEVRYVAVKGWKREHNWTASTDHMKSILSRLPNTPHGLDVSTANMAEEVVRAVRAAGMGDAAADIIRVAWVNASTAERQNMVIGLVRSFTQAMGINAVDPTAEAKILEQITGIGWKELYATNQIPRRAGVIADINAEGRAAAELKRQEVRAAQHLDIDARVVEIDAELTGARNATFTEDDLAAAVGFQNDVKVLQREVDDLEKQLASAEGGMSKSAEARLKRDALDEWWAREIVDESGMVGKTTNGELLESLFRWGMGRSPSRFEQTQLRKGMLPRGVADKFRKGKGDTGVGSDEAWNLFNSPTGVLDDGMSPNPEWQGVYEQAEKVGRQYYIEVPWARRSIQRAIDDAVDQAVAPDEYLDDLARQIESRQADIAMAREWLDANPEVVKAAAKGQKAPTKARIQELNRERKALLKKREQRIAAQLDAIKDERFIKRLMRQERKPGGRLNPKSQYNPSVDPTGKASALYVGQTSDYIAIPNFKVLDSYAARASYLNAFLFNNRVGSAVTELWVLGTLAGPRFQVRNATEDGLMYGLTGGSVGSFFRGRRLGQAIDQSMARVDASVLAAKGQAEAAKRALIVAERDFAKGKIDDAAIEAARKESKDADALLQSRLDERTFLGRQKYGNHKKLGVVRTTLVNLSERATYVPGTDRVRDGMAAKIAQFLVPTTSSFERAAAAAKGREAVAELAAKAVMRQKLVFTRSGMKKWIPARAKSEADLSPAQRQYLKWEKDLLDSPYGLQYKDDAAESAQHYADGGIPVERGVGQYVFDDRGNVMVKIPIDRGYTSQATNKTALNEKQARALMAHLRFMADKYSINQAALHQVPEYWRALNKAGGADTAKVDAVIENVLAWTRSSSDWPYIATRFRLADDLGAKEHIRRMLDDMADTFTTRGGNWNQGLWRAMRQTDDKGKVYFTTDAVDDMGDPILNEVTLMEGKFKSPISVLVHGSDDYFLAPASAKFFSSTNAWEMMGRSLARMTRNPIWYGNYLKARGQLKGLEQHYASIFGEAHAARMFTDAAAERAYNLTMAWVDNPNVRTNLSWQVRNIARYYRAQEDFARRVIRMVKYDPGSIQKANLAWQAQQDVGFVYTDEYGDQYFIYPGSAAVMGVLQNIFGGLNIGGLKYSAAPMAFGGKVQWLSPSLDPNSWLPTVSSPWMAVTLQPLLRTMPGANAFFKEVERWTFGDITANMDYTELNLGDGLLENTVGGFYQALPPNIKKLVAAGEGVFGNIGDGSYGYKMTAKTIMAMAAADQIPQGDEWADENVRREFLEALERRTIEMSLLSLVFGFFAPASPQFMPDYASAAAREAGYSSLNPAFQEMVRASVDNGDSWEEAQIKWMRSNPKDGVFIQSQSESIGGAYVEATERNVAFLADHEDLFNENPIGVTFFMPDEKGAKTTDGAWQALKTFDLRRYKPLEKILMQVANAEGNVETALAAVAIEEQRAGIQQYDDKGNLTPEWKALDEVERTAEAQLQAQYPTRQYGLGEWMEKDEAEFAIEAEQVVTAARTLAAEGKSFAMAVLPLVDAYREISREYATFRQTGQNPETYDEENRFRRDVWQTVINNWWADTEGSFPRDRAEKIIKLFTYSMNKGWSRSIALPGEEQQ